MPLPVKLIHPFHLIKKDGDCLSDSLVVHCFGLFSKNQETQQINEHVQN